MKEFNLVADYCLTIPEEKKPQIAGEIVDAITEVVERHESFIAGSLKVVDYHEKDTPVKDYFAGLDDAIEVIKEHYLYYLKDECEQINTIRDGQLLACVDIINSIEELQNKIKKKAIPA